MLTIVVPEFEVYDESTSTFQVSKETNLMLEHSLLSLSKWEAKWCKPFLSDTMKTTEEVIDYIRCMTINRAVDPIIYKQLTVQNIKDVGDYIAAPMSATTIINHRKAPKSKETVTSELIYFWMVSFGIPFECEKWHLNRLMKLIEICGVKNQTNNKMSRAETVKSNRALNEIRRAKLHTKG